MLSGDRGRAFTMIELLSVVSIVGILIAFALPVFGKVRATGDSVKCASNLRQIGLGILYYARENDSTLPGPLYVGVYPWYKDSVALSYRIRKYLPIYETYKKPKDDVFVCPAYARVVTDYKSVPDYMLNVEVRMSGDSLMHQPFGYPHPFLVGSTLPMQELFPMRLSQLGDICDENGAPAQSSVWAIKDADARDDIMSYSTFYNLLPAEMLHGTHRNALFFDFHVGKVDLQNSAL